MADVLCEGGVKNLLQLKRNWRIWRTRRSFLEFDLEGARFPIQKEGQEKFEAKIVLDTLKEFAKKVDQIGPPNRRHLFQYPSSQHPVKDLIFDSRASQESNFTSA